MLSPQVWSAPTWVDPTPIWVPPEHASVTLTHITNPDDLATWGKYMGHSGARYQKWAIDTPIWVFLTFLDADGWPHVTIHLKEEEYLFRSHPDDKFALSDKQWKWGYTRGPVHQGGIAKFWLHSTLYDSISALFDRPVLFNNKRMVVMAAGHVDRDPLYPRERYLVNDWYQSVVIPGTAPVRKLWLD